MLQYISSTYRVFDVFQPIPFARKSFSNRDSAESLEQEILDDVQRTG